MNETVSRLMEANLLGVFNERDGERRAAAIRSTYAPDVRWTDDEGVSVGHEALEARAQGLQQHSQGLVFTKRWISGTWLGTWVPRAAIRSQVDSTSQSFATTSSLSFIRSLPSSDGAGSTHSRPRSRCRVVRSLPC